MKTSVVLKSSDRDLFDIIIRQNTKEQFLSVTDLQQAYERARWQHGWSDRRINDLLQYAPVQDRCYYLLSERGILKTTLPVFKEMTMKEGIVKVLKGLGVWKMTGKGKDRAVFCDPFIWMLLAMELNPMIYAKVVIWLTDSLIFDRMEAGGEYLPMNSAIKRVIANPDYPRFAKTINERVFGRHQPGMRNIASAKELRKIADIEKFITNAIEQGWLKNETDILSAIKNYN